MDLWKRSEWSEELERDRGNQTKKTKRMTKKEREKRGRKEWKDRGKNRERTY